ARSLDQGLSRDGHRHAGPVLRHPDQDRARHARERQDGEPHRRRQGRAVADGSFQSCLIARPLGFQGRVTCDAVLAKADGGCFGIRRRSAAMAPDSRAGMIQKSPQSGFASEDSKEGSTSMKRTVMFLLLGPSLVALAVWMVAVAIAGRVDDAFVALCATASFLLTLPVSAITGLADGYLASALPAPLRAP